jgi:hypothetical protein
MVDVDITTVLLIAAILAVLILIFRDDTDPDSTQTESQSEIQRQENYAPNIDGDFNKYASAYDPYYHYSTPSVGWLSRRGLLPWWNSTRDTKNMSYDIRGDIPPFNYPVGPWLNSPVVDHPYRFREIY